MLHCSLKIPTYGSRTQLENIQLSFNPPGTRALKLQLDLNRSTNRRLKQKRALPTIETLRDIFRAWPLRIKALNTDLPKRRDRVEGEDVFLVLEQGEFGISVHEMDFLFDFV